MLFVGLLVGLVLLGEASLTRILVLFAAATKAKSSVLIVPAMVLTWALLVLVIVFFGWMFFAGDWTPSERRRLYAIGALFVASALFWSEFVHDRNSTVLKDLFIYIVVGIGKGCNLW